MKNSRKRSRILFIFTCVVLMMLCILFIIDSFRDEIVFFYAPKDLTQQKLQKIANQKIKVGGLVKKDSVQKIDALNIKFIIEDGQGEITIKYRGLTPDLFREGQGIIAVGKFGDDLSIFISSQLLVKHDEKYMPPEVKKSLENKSNY